MSIKSESEKRRPPVSVAHVSRLLREASAVVARAEPDTLAASQIAAVADALDVGNVLELDSLRRLVAESSQKLDEAHRCWRVDIDALTRANDEVADLKARLERLENEPAAVRVIRPGTEVQVAGEVPGRVTAVILEAGPVQYRVAWWNGRERRHEWLTEREVTPTDPVRVPVGFATA